MGPSLDPEARRANRWLILDGDDTLWRTTPLYDRARQRLLDLVAARGHDPAAVDAWVRARDVENAKTLGYSMHRFPRSLRETAEHFLGDGEHAWAALGFGYAVFAEVCAPTDGVGAVLDALADDWNLALLTAGEVTVQEKRLADFPHTGRFRHTRIVPAKSPAVFRAFAMEIGADPAASWVVGDSLRSDVLPAVAAGFNAVHYDTANWACYETAGHQRPDGVHVLGSLADLPDLLAQATAVRRPEAA